MLADKLFSVGLTGGIGSGKSLVADMLGERGATVIDTDQIAHQLTVPNGLAIAPIEAEFGPEFLSAEGALDRARMREHVFTDPSARKRLEAILHPLIRIETERATQNARGVYAVYVVPLLVESGSWKNRVDRVLVVDCPESVQIARVMARNGLPEAQVRAIMSAQASRAERLAAADDVIINDGDKAALGPLIEKLHARYLSLANRNSVK